MPEYLAPGVYVEETSFRAKSIEGVGTSTTGFVGPTRKGPVGGTPELITSFGDFERIYGGLANLSLGPADDLTRNLNYVAHSVRAYFDNGGSRLYVSRVFTGSNGNGGRASSVMVVNGNSDAERARFVARFPGEAGGGRIGIRQMETPATLKSMTSAPTGTMLRLRRGSQRPALPAQLEGGMPPFSVGNNSRLLLSIAGVGDREIAFNAKPAEAFASEALPDSFDLSDEDAQDPAKNSLRVTVDGVSQAVTLPTGATSRADLVSAINGALTTGASGGTARLTDDTQAPANRLVIGSKRKGKLASVTVKANEALGFTDDSAVSGSADATGNNVNDPTQVTADEINSLLASGNVPARATLSPDTGRLVLSTTAAEGNATLAVRTGDGSIHEALGFPPSGRLVRGRAGSASEFYVKSGNNWINNTGATLNLGGLEPTQAPAERADFITMIVATEDRDGNQMVYEDVGFHPNHPRWLGHMLAVTPKRRAESLENMFALDVGAGVDAFELMNALFAVGEQRIVTMAGGSDGSQPTQFDYEKALKEFENIEDISIVAAPGHSAYDDFQGIQSALISHAERRRSYRIAVLDTPPAQSVSEARTVRSRIDSKYAAMYHPWVVISNPLARPGAENIPREISVPPSGFVCGIYARNDIERGVFKAPANEVVRGALRFETDINFAEQEVLNPLGVNCLRFFPGRGYRVWGARTASSDPEWKYVNVRRYFNYLERSIDRGTQWAVFEPNGERLWANIRETVSSFLYNEWVSGALLGASTKEAYFVRCDRSTMTQNDLDNGRLICLIGVAVVQPAEFVVFRIGQKTVEARS